MRKSMRMSFSDYLSCQARRRKSHSKPGKQADNVSIQLLARWWGGLQEPFDWPLQNTRQNTVERCRLLLLFSGPDYLSKSKTQGRASNPLVKIQACHDHTNLSSVDCCWVRERQLSTQLNSTLLTNNLQSLMQPSNSKRILPPVNMHRGDIVTTTQSNVQNTLKMLLKLNLEKKHGLTCTQLSVLYDWFHSKWMFNTVGRRHPSDNIVRQTITFLFIYHDE